MKIELRPFRLSDIDRLVHLANNRRISDNLRDAFPFPYSEEVARRFIEKTLNDEPISIFAIELDGLHVGNIGLHPEADIYSESAELGYFIGEEYWGKGIATKAVKRIVDFGFKTLDLNRIHAGVLEHNIGSMRVLEKNNFIKEGVSRKNVVKNGVVLDEHQYAILHPRFI